MDEFDFRKVPSDAFLNIYHNTIKSSLNCFALTPIELHWSLFKGAGQDMAVVTFVIAMFFRVLHLCQAQNNENCALTKASTGELGMRNGYESSPRVIPRVIGGHNSNYAPWQVALSAGVNIRQRNSILPEKSF